MKENGGKLTIIEEAKKSVIQDVVYRQIPLAKKEQQILRENWKIWIKRWRKGERRFKI
ncbi:hypothetical protein E5L00_03545 [Helicobacter pylori]|nr:hypothetical protein E5L00_03545 [Helicobacter pylori]